ncbi:restriction endonuclease subunit S [Pantoea ananatis]|uniref:restriction endonuclease subunit S n=1 Tax=Pantoea ananas TaxID=553 RepID=UPI002350DB17|nr:restriction endonuclease subunit S [Pantoea ananatis]MDC7861790.1 type I restriction endonuclease [Pantoea ananatis]
MKLSDLVDFNPKRALKKGTYASFVEMASLPENGRDISNIGSKIFTGSGSKFSNGDTLFARITPCLENGKTSLVSGLLDDEVAFGSTEFIVLSAKQPEYDSNYIYYLSRLPEFRSFAQSRMEGTSGRQRVAWQSLAEYEYEFPDKAYRKYAGEFLKKFDDKILLNHHINQTLEQMAQALFKSWFVDFEPVKAKMAALEGGGSLEDATLAAMKVISGKDAKALVIFEREHPEQYTELKATAKLFPSAMQKSEFGDIPKGWKLGRLSDIAIFANGKIDVSSLTHETYISTENMLENRMGISSASTLPSANSVPSFSCGQVLISNIRPYFKKIWLSQFNGGRSADVLAFEPRGVVSVEYIYNLLYQDSFFDFMMLTSKGVKMPRGDKTAIMQWQCICPEKKISDAFSNAVSKYYPYIENNIKENKTLSQLRDTLLSQFMSGEIDLSNIAISSYRNNEGE